MLIFSGHDHWSRAKCSVYFPIEPSKCRHGASVAQAWEMPFAISVFHVLSQSVVTSYAWWSGKCFPPTGTWHNSVALLLLLSHGDLSLSLALDNHIALDHLTVEIFRVIVPRTVHLSGHSGHRDCEWQSSIN